MGELVYLTSVEGVPDSKNPEFIYITETGGSFILSVDKSILLQEELISDTYTVAVNVLDADGTLLKKIEIIVTLTST